MDYYVKKKHVQLEAFKTSIDRDPAVAGTSSDEDIRMGNLFHVDTLRADSRKLEPCMKCPLCPSSTEHTVSLCRARIKGNM